MTFEYFAAAAAIFFAYMVRGISGFGSALVAVPLLVHSFPLTTVVPLIAVLDLMAASWLTGVGQRNGQVRWAEVARLLPGTLVGIVLGLQLLVSLDRELLLVVLGAFIIAFGARSLLGGTVQRTVSSWWSVPAGLIGGGVGAVFSTGGPPYVIFLSHRLVQKGSLRATLSAVFLVDGALRVGALAIAGLLLPTDMGWYLLLGVPLMAAGLTVGNHIHLGLSRRQMTVAVAVLLLASGLSLLLRVWNTA